MKQGIRISKKIFLRIVGVWIIILSLTGITYYISNIKESHAATIVGTQFETLKVNNNPVALTTKIVKEANTQAIFAPITELFSSLEIELEFINGRYVGTFNKANITIPLNESYFIYDSVQIELNGKTQNYNGVDMFDISYLSDIYGIEYSVLGTTISITTEQIDRRNAKQKALENLDLSSMVSVTREPSSQAALCNEAYGAWCGYQNAGIVSTVGINLDSNEYACEDNNKCRIAYQTTTYGSYNSGWTNHGFGLNIKSGEEMNAGDIGIITFYARATEINDEFGDGMLMLNIQSFTPTTILAPTYIPLTYEWQKYTIIFKVPTGATFATGRMHFVGGTLPQTIQISTPNLYNMEDSITYEDYYYDYSSTRTYRGQESDALWREVANRRIEKYRKDLLFVEVQDKDGNIVENADVTINMTKNHFNFGTAVHGNISGTDNFSIDYQNRVKELFNSITSENAFKWTAYHNNKSTETGRSKSADNVVNFAAQNNIGVRGHNLIWDSSGHYPGVDRFNVLGLGNTKTLNWWEASSVTQDSATKLIKYWVDDILNAYLRDSNYDPNTIYEWDVQNEPFSENNGGILRTGRSFGSDYFAENLFCYIRKEYPEVVQFINDYNLLNYTFDGEYNTKKLINLVESYENYTCSDGNKVVIDGIGLQMYPTDNSYRTFSPQSYYNNLVRLGNYAEKIALTEYRAGGADSSTAYLRVATDLLEDLLIATYSMPQATGFTLWGFYNSNAAYANQNLLFNTSGQPQEGYHIWKNLMQTWSTNVVGKTDTDGMYSTKAYYGDYDITINYNGDTTTKSYSMVENGTNKVVVRLGNETTPEDLTLNSLTVTEGIMTPAFSKNIKQYSITVPYTVTSLTLSAKATSTTSSVSILGNKDFEVGNNLVQIVVTGASGNKNIYNINVIRLDSNGNNTGENNTGNNNPNPNSGNEENPNTGYSIPVILLIALLLISVVTYKKLSKKNKFYKI